MWSTASLAAPSRYRWVILGVGFITQFLAYGLWYAFPVFFVAILDELGWQRGPAAGAFSTFVLIAALVAAPAGTLTDRFGPRLVIAGGAALLAVGLAACAFLTELWQLYLWYGVIGGVGIGLAGWISNVTSLSHWFPRSVASAVGFTSAGVGLSILFVVPGMQALVSTIGWRQAFLVLAGLNLLLVPLNLVLHRALPRLPAEDVGEVPAAGHGRSETARRDADSAASRPADLVVDRAWVARGWTLGLAARTARFWLLALGFFSISFAGQLLIVHSVAYLVDHGIQAAAAAAAVGLVGLASIPAKVLGGPISDRLGRELTLTLYVGLVLTGLVLLVVTATGVRPELLYVFPLFIGLGYACIGVLAPAMSADLYRGPSFGSIFGAIACGVGCGGALGAWAAGAVFDLTGSYALAFAGAALACVIAVVCGWLAAPRKVRRVPKALRSGRSRLTLAATPRG